MSLSIPREGNCVSVTESIVNNLPTQLCGTEKDISESIDPQGIIKFIGERRTTYELNKKEIQKLERSTYHEVKAGRCSSIRVHSDFMPILDLYLQLDWGDNSLASKLTVADSFYLILKSIEKQFKESKGQLPAVEYKKIMQAIKVLDELIDQVRTRSFSFLVKNVDPCSENHAKFLHQHNLWKDEGEILTSIRKHLRLLESRMIKSNEQAHIYLSTLCSFFIFTLITPTMLRLLDFKLKNVQDPPSHRPLLTLPGVKSSDSLVDVMQLLLDDITEVLQQQKNAETGRMASLEAAKAFGSTTRNSERLDLERFIKELDQCIVAYKKQLRDFYKRKSKNRYNSLKTVLSLKLSRKTTAIDNYFFMLQHVIDKSRATKIHKNLNALFHLSNILVTKEVEERAAFQHDRLKALENTIADFNDLVVPMVRLSFLMKESKKRLKSLDVTNDKEDFKELLNKFYNFQVIVDTALTNLLRLHKRGKAAKIQEILANVHNGKSTLEQMQQLLKTLSLFSDYADMLMDQVTVILPKLSEKFTHLSEREANNNAFEGARDDFLFFASSIMVVKNWLEELDANKESLIAEPSDDSVQPPQPKSLVVAKKKKKNRKKKKKKKKTENKSTSEAPPAATKMVVPPSPAVDATTTAIINEPNTTTVLATAPLEKEKNLSQPTVEKEVAPPLQPLQSFEEVKETKVEVSVAKPQPQKEAKAKREKRAMTREEKREVSIKALKAIEKNEYSEELYRAVKETLRNTGGDFRKICKALSQKYGLKPGKARGSHIHFVRDDGASSHHVIIPKHSRDTIPLGTLDSVAVQIATAITPTKQDG